MPKLSKGKKDLLNQLLDKEIIKFGDFTLKSGIQSPFYVDFRASVSYPKLQSMLVKELWNLIRPLEYDLICGVPYAALSLTAVIGHTKKIPQIIKRKERKQYGTGKLVEGHFEKGDNCLLIDDIVTSGTSMIETANALTDEGLIIHHLVSLVDREQGGKQILEKLGLQVHTLFSFSEIIEFCYEEKKISKHQFNLCLDFIANNQVQEIDQTRIPYYRKKKFTKHKKNKQLLKIIEKKRSNLCCSADVITSKELLKLADTVGPNICLLKTHIDILQDFDYKVIKQLKKLALKHNFLILEDRKFADIGNISINQFLSGVHHIANWADFITVQVIAGAKSIEALISTKRTKETGLILIAEMSTEDTLTDKDYINAALSIAKKHPKAVSGIVAQNVKPPHKGQLLFTPGIKLVTGEDKHGQVYNTPSLACDRGTDVLIVGRGIYQAKNPKKAAANYRKAGWNAIK